MTWIFDPNNDIVADDGASALFLLKQHLVAAGWSVPISNNGTTAGPGDQIAAVADLTDPNSWMVLRRPDGGSEWLFFGGGTGTRNWDVLYSASAGFAGGDTVSRPTALDQQFIISDAVSMFLSGNQTWSYAADDAAPYGWAAFGWQTGGTTVAALLVYDPMAEGTYYDDDPDPYVCGVTVQFGEYRLYNEDDSLDGTVAKGWTGPSSTGTWGSIPGGIVQSSSGNALFPAGCGNNPYSGSAERPTAPISYGRNTAQPGTSGFKGFGTVVRAVGSTQAVKDTLTEGDDSYIVFGLNNDICVRWPQGVAPT